jgi:hypothetical protein
MGMPAPDSVKRLVDHFDLGRKVFPSGDYKEEQLRLESLPYEFSVMPVDVLVKVYEQFLGKVIRLTSSHQAKVEERSKGFPDRAFDRSPAPRRLSAMASEPSALTP